MYICFPEGEGGRGLSCCLLAQLVGMYHDSGMNTALMQLHIVCKFHFVFFLRVGLKHIGRFDLLCHA